jgi:lipid II:glycine glycyltransferase (peptidoglycan interpeptide bridge formation enzyme)
MRESRGRGDPAPGRNVVMEESLSSLPRAESGLPGILDAAGMSAAEWDALAARSPMGDVYQSHEWAEVKRTLGWTILRYVVQHQGRDIAAVSIQERRVSSRLPGPLGRATVHYAPRGPILLESSPEAVTAALDGLRGIAVARGSVALTIDPAWQEESLLADALALSAFRPAAREVQVSRTAMVIPLKADEAAQHALLHDSMATDINRARRAGVTIERVDMEAEASREAGLMAFYDMHEATGRRKGYLVRDRDYELNQWRSLGRAGLASMWFASAEGRHRSGVLLFHCGRNVVLFAAGSPDDADLRKWRANHLLHWSIMRWAVEAGFTGYDLGGVDTHKHPGLPSGPDHPLWNLYEFKVRLGAVPQIHVRAHEYSPNAALGALWRAARRIR